jgi:hypothetical protein
MKTVFNTNRVKSILAAIVLSASIVSCSKDEVEPIKELEAVDEIKSILPENDKTFTDAELELPTAFRWTPLVPKPRDPVTYRLKVWQLMQGQNPQTAMTASEPLFVKEVVDATETQLQVYTGPCKPPYLCDYVWEVVALEAGTDGNIKTTEIIVGHVFHFKPKPLSDPIVVDPIPTEERCDTKKSDFQQIFNNLVSISGYLDKVTYDSEIHSYSFVLSSPKKVCSIGYQSQPGIASTPYKIEIFNNTTNTLVYSGSHVFSSSTTSYVTISGVSLNATDSYTIKRIQTNWGSNIGNTIGRLVVNPSGNVPFPQTSGVMKITGSLLHQNAATQTDWAIPYIDIIFQ